GGLGVAKDLVAGLWRGVRVAAPYPLIASQRACRIAASILGLPGVVTAWSRAQIRHARPHDPAQSVPPTAWAAPDARRAHAHARLANGPARHDRPAIAGWGGAAACGGGGGEAVRGAGLMGGGRGWVSTGTGTCR